MAKGHLAAFKALESKSGFQAFNLGTGKGTSVLEIVQAFREVSGQPIKTVFAPRRAGDVAWMWCCPEKAKQSLGWEATQNVTQMCADLWRFQQKNPQGPVQFQSQLYFVIKITTRLQENSWKKYGTFNLCSRFSEKVSCGLSLLKRSNNFLS